MKKIYSLALIALLATSCSDDTMDNINKDNANPPADKVPAYLQITDAIMSTGFTTTSGAYAWYLSSITEQEIGSGNNQLMKVEMRNANELAASSTYNNEWNGTYGNLMNLKQIIDKVKEGSGTTDEGQLDLLGMAQVLTAINYGVLTDLHGDIPCSEALQGLDNLQPNLDKQEDVYKYIFATLESAIDNISKAREEEMENVGSQDILYGNDMEQWQAAANAVMARYKLHTLYRNPAVLDEVIDYANKAVNLGFKGMYITTFNGITCDNPWSAYVWSRYYTACSSTVYKIMEATSDPRADGYCLFDVGEDEPDWQYVACDPGDEATAKESAWPFYPVWIDYSPSVQVMSEAELYFILAEAYMRKGNVDDAHMYFNDAVRAAFGDLENIYGVDFGADDFLAQWSEGVTLSDIMAQKYVSQIRDEQIETYNDLRRCAALGEEHITLTNPYNTQSGINRWPLRLPYGNSGVISNSNIKAAYGDGSYIFTEKIWLYGGTR